MSTALRATLDGASLCIMLTVLVNIAGYNWISPRTFSCGPDGLKISGADMAGPQIIELCREVVQSPRPILIDQKSVVCWKKTSGEWQWEPCNRDELSKRHTRTRRRWSR